MPGTTVPVAGKNISQPAPLLINIDDFSRVKLTTIQGHEGSDYINASFVDVSII